MSDLFLQNAHNLGQIALKHCDRIVGPLPYTLVSLKFVYIFQALQQPPLVWALQLLCCDHRSLVLFTPTLKTILTL